VNYLIIGLAALNLVVVLLIYSKKYASSGITVYPDLLKPISELQTKIEISDATLSGNLASFTTTLSNTISNDRIELRSSISENHKAVEERLTKFTESLDGNARLGRQDAANGRIELEKTLTDSLRNIEAKISLLTESNEKKQSEIRESLQAELEKLRKGNEEKLEKMRETVDEKLQGTLEKRLGESFKQVSDKLEAVHKGLGEMQSLATGVGDLKRVLTNVKSRGGWGEVQLSRQLEDMLTQDQYGRNVTINPATREVVEYAIKLPGRADGEVIYLPIDSKFPQEDYERLVIAQENGAIEEIESMGKNIERAIKAQAKSISEKYICPPYSTDFAIMYLPTEGLFAEVIRRPGLCSDLQNTHRIIVTGPTTLMAILNSLQMGFKTLAIEKSASDVWKILGAAKAEFNKYGKVWEKLEKQLTAAQNTVADAGKRSRMLERELRKVESFELGSGQPILELVEFNLADTDDAVIGGSGEDAAEGDQGNL